MGSGKIAGMTKESPQKRYWRIEGYDSTEKIFEKRIPISQIGENKLQDLLRALTAKASLTYNEIVGAYANRGTEIANDLLEVHRDGPYPRFACGTNPHFYVCIVDEDGKVWHPTLPVGL